MIRFAALAFCAALLSACAATPPPAADFGAPPTNYEADIRNTINPYLKDADSARYQFGEPRKAFRVNPLNQPNWAGYLVITNVNGKNSYGGYTGFKPYFVLFKDGELETVLPPDGMEQHTVRGMDGKGIR